MAEEGGVEVRRPTAEERLREDREGVALVGCFWLLYAFMLAAMAIKG